MISNNCSNFFRWMDVYPQKWTVHIRRMLRCTAHFVGVYMFVIHRKIITLISWIT